MSDLHEPGMAARSFRDPALDEERMPFAPLEPPPELVIDTAELELPLSMADREPHQRPRLPSLKIDIDPPTQVSEPGPPQALPDPPEPVPGVSALIASYELPPVSLEDVPTLTIPEPFAATLPGPPSLIAPAPPREVREERDQEPLQPVSRPGPVLPELPKVPPDLSARVAANIAADFADDANIPMLTEVLHVPRYPGGELPATLGDVDWNQLTARVSENVMERLQRRSEKLLDEHLRESLRGVLDRATASLAIELQAGLQQMMRDLVKRAVAEELTRVHAEIERRNFDRGPR